jgi:AcrR family transcriptional regulator
MNAARRIVRRRSGLSTGRGRRLGATEPEEPTGTERFGGRRPEVPRALSSLRGRVRYRLRMTDGRVKAGSDNGSRREKTVVAAMRRFAEYGYRDAHVEAIAHEVGVAKGTVFLDFGSKEGLFLAAYQHAVQMLPAWLDAPPEVVDRGFWDTLDWWLQSTEEFVERDPVPNRLAMIGRNDTGIGLRRPIDRFMRSEDPYGTLEFVEFGVRTLEIRDDVDVEMIASMLDWLAQRFQDALVSEDLDPGLIHRRPERRDMRIKEFVEILRGGIAAVPEQP